jgi:hypothetical protein
VKAVNCRFDEKDHRYFIDDYPVAGVTNALREAGIVDTTWFTEWARDRGSKVHTLTQFDDEGSLDPESIDPLIAGYLAGWRKFRKEYDFKIDDIELEVYHSTAMYGGTLDRLGWTTYNGITYKTIVDIKSGLVVRATGLQLTGYADAYQDMTGEFVGRIMGVQIKQDGTYKQTTFPLDFMTWRAVLQINNWKQEA